MKETGFQRTIRLTVGILLAAEAVVLWLISIVLLFFVPFIGGLAFLGGAGGATDNQIEKTTWMLGLMIVLPFVMTGLVTVGAVQILKRKRPMMAGISCALAIAGHIAFHQLPDIRFIWVSGFTLAVLVGGVLVASQMRPAESPVDNSGIRAS